MKKAIPIFFQCLVVVLTPYLFAQNLTYDPGTYFRKRTDLAGFGAAGRSPRGLQDFYRLRRPCGNPWRPGKRALSRTLDVQGYGDVGHYGLGA